MKNYHFDHQTPAIDDDDCEWTRKLNYLLL